MSNRDNLFRIVEKAIEEHGFGTFAKYWELYEETVDVSDVQRFYFTMEPQWHGNGGYCNVAIIGDGLLVDVEGDDTRRSGGLNMQTLDSVTRVSAHAGALPGIPNAQGATLIIMTDRANEHNVGIYWVAKTDEDQERLIQFTSTLVKAVSNR